MDLEEAKRRAAAIESNEEFQELARNLEGEPGRSESFAFLGVPYKLGTGEVSPACAPHLPALSLVGSKLLTDPEAAVLMDYWKALYVISNDPKTVLAEFCGLEHRLSALESRLEKSEDRDEKEICIRLIDEITAKSWGEFDRKTLEFSKQFGEVEQVEVITVAMHIIQDALSGFSLLGSPAKKNDEPDKKKPSSTLTFWQKLKSTLCGLVSHARKQ